MTQDSDQFIDEQFEDFSKRLAAIAYHHRQACALQFADRLRQELAGHTAVPEPPTPLLTRVRRWVANRWEQSQPPQPWPIPEGMADQEGVVMIDAAYTVVSPETNHEEGTQWVT